MTASPLLSFEAIAYQFRQRGIVLTRTPAEYSVNYANGKPDTAETRETLPEAPGACRGHGARGTGSSRADSVKRSSKAPPEYETEGHHQAPHQGPKPAAQSTSDKSAAGRRTNDGGL